ncbi:hypothetical protein FA95DRAFT_1598679 [Auriscalpium vulgare]|uniref:Uncharacterized protein n=1 Tax=Auriscalpium vulgare TaxID=40419 RepID=A0ACB8RD16_9AGAM|nr:hypothetical protein FA95DRAFT_1598679 [Auriscalpium vulgare]
MGDTASNGQASSSEVVPDSPSPNFSMPALPATPQHQFMIHPQHRVPVYNPYYTSPAVRFNPATIFNTHYPQVPSTPQRRQPAVYVAGHGMSRTPTRRRDDTPGRSARSPRKKRRMPRSNIQKLAHLLHVIKTDLNWSLGTCLYYLFRVRDETAPDHKVHRTHEHAAVVSRFLGGRTRHTPADILECWLRSPDGRPARAGSQRRSAAEDESYMYSLDTSYTEIKAARPALTSFAVQIMRDRILGERREAVKPESGVSPAIVNLDTKAQKIKEGHRKNLTVDDLLDMIDYEHLDTVASLQWLDTIVSHIPQLAHYKADVIELFQTEGAKRIVPGDRRSNAYPLSTNGKNESLVAELKDTLVDFFEQLGQSEEDYLRRIWFVGGDGLTFEKMLQLKQLLQFEGSGFARMDWIEPFLELWHTEWTDLSRIFETHWGDELGRDPSTLGYSAGKINIKRPSNLKKVDYYSGTHLAYLVLDVHIMDCVRIHYKCDDIFQEFERRAAEDDIPTLAELKSVAQRLHRTYSSLRAYHSAMQPHDPDNQYAVPLGDPWDKPEWMTATSTQADANSEPTGASASRTQSSAKGRGKKKAEAEDPDAPEIVHGDEALAQTSRFMFDTLMSRNVANAAPNSDIGRIWEVLKLWVFTFAGSTHTKYPTYLLEMICSLELESTPELREFFLDNWLVNLQGEAGKHIEGDLMIEHNNKILQGMVGRRDATWDGHYLRDIVSPNTFLFGTVKTAFTEGAGLEPIRGRHPAPHTRPEFRTLSKIYREEGLHLFREGRSYNVRKRDVNNYERGVAAMENGRLAKWIDDSTAGRLLAQQDAAAQADALPSDTDTATDDELSDQPIEHDDQMSGHEPETLGMHLQSLAWRFAVMIDGQFQQDVLEEDLPQAIAEARAELDDEALFEDWQEEESEGEPEIEFADA